MRHFIAKPSVFLLAVISYVDLTCARLDPASAHVARTLNCCDRLSNSLSSKVVYSGSSFYNDSTSYWAAAQNAIKPLCVVRPTTAEDVSSAIVTLVGGSCKFAVRTGGHGSVTAISTIQHGITIDMRGLDAIALNDDNSVATIGAGQTWGPAYSALYQVGVTIPGGRDYGIGIGGSILGDALGYLAPQTGFGADSVIEFEVVIANGSIVTANKDLNHDLWRSLKGGSSNFGIVTKVIIETTAVGDIWASSTGYDSSAIDSEAQAFHDFVADPSYDVKAVLLLAYSYTAAAGYQIANLYTYTAPIEKPAAFASFYSIDGQIGNVSALTNIPDYSVDQDATSPDGLQQITFSTTFTNNVQQLKDVWSIHNKSIASIVDIADISWSLTLEPLTASLAAASAARGGNVMNVEVPPEGLILTLGSFSFSSACNYSYMNKEVDKLLKDIEHAAKKNGVYNPFIGLNHAKGSQDVMKSYGADSYAFLKQTAKKYDPDQVFQKLMPGGFKL
ncbi:hypothetical protein E0Z10_g10666 [Xylaria hypoxylon]|uniref:FAD-binding PCMH-type domain-containing protein n=1 Tax=Xylaria hypoxylon TaxID=37992 RepID=A0A4Z0YFX7_9PEZI|nr:hypothetical protein E0Z10_g10666 [Xylaria hypoxylon]